MAKPPPFLLLLLLLFTPTTPCNPSDACTCFPGDVTEIQCPSHLVPPQGPSMVFHLSSLTAKIDCYSLLRHLPHLLPNVTLESATRLELHSCPLPSTSLKSIADHFRMGQVRVLVFDHASTNVSLGRRHLEGFGGLSRLKLNGLNLTGLDEDVFDGLSGLFSLEMEKNRNLTLSGRHFRGLGKLKSLFLAQNDLGEISDGLFASLNQLGKLHLWANSLRKVGDNTFKGLVSLESLELNSNKIESISEGAFAHLANLSSINLSGNRLTKMAGIFKSNPNLKTVLFTYNVGLQLPEYFFAGLPVLEEVDLSRCKLTSIPEDIFENSTNVAILNLESNKMATLSPLLLKNLSNLKSLNLRNNLITEIGENVFKDLILLEKVNLERNKIVRIHPETFRNKNNLKIINLSDNSFSNSINVFAEVLNVEELLLSNNTISYLFPLDLMLKLQKLDLRHNQITEFKLKDVQAVKTELNVYLDYNNISSINFTDVDGLASSGVTWVSLVGNPFRCDCHGYQLYQFLNGLNYPNQKDMFEIDVDDLICDGLKDQKFKDLEPEKMVCQVEEKCPDDCSCFWRPYDRSVVVDCSCNDLRHLPVVDETLKMDFQADHVELDLQGNELQFWPNSSCRGYDDVTSLILSRNRIEHVGWLPPKLEVLRLDHNYLGHLDDHVLDLLRSPKLSSLSFDNNPWKCDCRAANFTGFLRERALKVVNSSAITCHGTSTPLIHLSPKDLCQSQYFFFILIPIMSLLVLVTVLTVLYYRYQEPLKIFLYSRNMCLWWVTEEELDKDKIYDAFISYSHRDEDFLVQNLLPVLEGGPNPYKLCLHYRHFVPGEFITTQVINSVMESRRTLVILSKNFLESVWGKMEFRTAHTQAMTEGRARVIIVLYGDVDVENLDEELKSYMKTNTYVKWGDPYFWNKLKYALPHSRRSKGNHQRIANVMSCIDDKFTLKEAVRTVDSSVRKKQTVC